MLSPAERATSTVEIERDRDSLTAFSAPESERWFWAMAQMAPLSLALATFRPVLMRVWVVLSSEFVLLRFCSATMAPTLVLTEFIGMIVVLPFWSGSRRFFAGGSFLTRSAHRNRRATGDRRGPEGKPLIQDDFSDPENHAARTTRPSPPPPGTNSRVNSAACAT